MAYRIEELQLKNFGMIEKFHCNQFSNINLIIGENGTGKTFLLKALYSAVKSLEEYKRGDDITPINDILSEKLRWTFQVDKLGDIVYKTAEDGPESRLDFRMQLNKKPLNYQFSKSATSKVGTVEPIKSGKEGNSIFIPAKEVLEQKLKNVDEEKIVSPESYVAVPAIQAISYSMNSDELRNLYANLLAKAMVISTKDEVHPSFVEIIKQMSPLDSIIFKEIMQRQVNPILYLTMENSDGAFNTFMTNVTDINLASQNLISVSIDNLARMKLIQIPEDGFYTNDKIYDSIFETDYYKKQKEIHPKTVDGFKFSYVKKMIEKTNLGKLFYEICVKEL